MASTLSPGFSAGLPPVFINNFLAFTVAMQLLGLSRNDSLSFALRASQLSPDTLAAVIQHLNLLICSELRRYLTCMLPDVFPPGSDTRVSINLTARDTNTVATLVIEDSHGRHLMDLDSIPRGDGPTNLLAIINLRYEVRDWIGGILNVDLSDESHSL